MQGVFVHPGDHGPLRRAQGGVVGRAAEVDEVHVLVRLARLGAVLQEDGVGRGDLPWIAEGEGVAQGQDLCLQARLLADLPQDGAHRVLVGLQVAAGGHPHLEALVPEEEGPVPFH